MVECVGCPRLWNYVVVSQHLSAYTAPGAVGFTTTQLVAVAGGLANTSNLVTELQIKITSKNIITTKVTTSLLLDMVH